MNKKYSKLDWDIVFRYVSRPIANILIEPIARTFITANQVTALSLILALVSAIMISFSNYKYNVIACLILQIVLILDCIDGGLARYRGQFTKFGMYFEYIFHELVPSALFFALGVNSYKHFNNIIPMYIAGITVLLIFFINVSRSSKERIVLYHIQKTKKVIGYAPHKIFVTRDKSYFNKIVVIALEIFNSPGYLFTTLLILSILNVLCYAIFFYGLFYFFVALGKAFLEFKQGFKPYGLE